ncbi:MAG: zinc ribbon domain-containing protein [Candidatus Micrarchaeota archaeon]
MKFCPDCGEKLSKSVPKHCPECGATLAAAREPAQAQAATPGILKTIPKKYYFYAGIALFLLLALFFSYAVGDFSQYSSKDEQAKQQTQMQLAVQQHKEELARQQVQADTARKVNLVNDIKRYSMASEYTKSQIAQAIMEYGRDNVSSANLEKKAEAAKKTALLINDYFSQLDGLKDYMLQKRSEILATGVSAANFTTTMDALESEKKMFRAGEKEAADELEKFAGSKPDRQKIIAEAVKLLREGEKST